jgi:hypothetical protein
MSIPVSGRKKFMVGKYEVIGQPIPGASHMLRYTVFAGKTRVGSMVSLPSESDCKFMENPPVVPPLKFFNLTNRPGRPKKGTKPPSATLDDHKTE